MSLGNGVAMLAMLGLAAALGTVLFTQMGAWSEDWAAWLATAPPDGPGYAGPRLEFLEQVPTFVVMGYAFLAVAMTLAAGFRR